MAELTAFVLAGGASSRMGTDKAFVMLEGRTLLATSIQVCRAVTNDVRIVGDRKKFAPFGPVVEDLFPGCGPLGGIHAALRASTSELNLMLAVDLPFVSPALLQFLVAQACTTPAAVTVPRVGGRWQPLCGVYRRVFAERADSALRQGRFKIDALFDEDATCVVEEEALQAAGFSPQMFRNLNTPEELARARIS
ncbi:MAG TPA: molybdenum cofactor guanylyltransferase [Candidatus Sulfotelmatobacter sp.]|nr:molybdenum cofactor guanylyltransferase [Candidatus Sulfotelmatobacter sp.]